MGKKKKVTVGYKYSWDIQAGLGRGPVDEVVAVTADEHYVFAGAPQEVTSNKTVWINKGNLFGGTDTGGEGGVEGSLEFAFGERDQVPSTALKGLLTGLIPGFRGVVTTFFSGMISAYSSSPKPWKYRVRRVTRGWDNGAAWYPEKALILLRNDHATINDSGLEPEFIFHKHSRALIDIGNDGSLKNKNRELQIDNLRTIHAMNPAHILIECATNRDWGRGLSFDDIDLPAYQQAADTLYNENFGLCFRYNRQDRLDTFIQQVLDHIGAVQYGDLRTGKLTMKLIRNDYNPDDLPLFTYDNGILGVQDDDSTSADSMTNEVVVTWHDPVTNKDDTVRAKNLGSIQSVGLISHSVDYKAIPTHELAARVAQRELEAGTSGLTRLVIKFDRRGGMLTPAGCFRISLPERGIDNLILRVGEIHEENDGSLKIKALQDVFGLPATSYSSAAQSSQWTAPDNTSRPVSLMSAMEIPYFALPGWLSDADIQALPPDAGFIGVVASAPTVMSVNYALQSRTGSQGFATVTDGDWTDVSVLPAELGRLDDRLAITMNTWPVVGDGILIDDEIISVDGVNINTGVLTIGRGCADTLPAKHSAGALVWLFSHEMTVDPTEYMAGEVVDIRMLTRTPANILDPQQAPVTRLSLQQRQFRPLPPGNLKVNGQYADNVTGSGFITLAWSHRDRLLQGNSLLPHFTGDIGPEPGTKYIIRLYKGSVLLRKEITDKNTWSYPPSVLPADEIARLPRWENIDTLSLYSERDGLESWQGYILPASVSSGTAFDE
ncbi:hypothetical protein AAE121_004883, partial [Salmonella enterica]